MVNLALLRRAVRGKETFATESERFDGETVDQKAELDRTVARRQILKHGGVHSLPLVIDRLLDEAMAIHRAQTLRFGYRNVRLGYRSLAMLVSLLFTRVLIRYQQMSTVLDIKLYQGDFHL